MDTIRAFRTAVASAFGTAPWLIEPAADGFVARLALNGSVTDFFTIDVRVDESAGTFTMTSRRSNSETTDVTHRTATSYARDVDHRAYTGIRQTFVFARTPKGLVPDSDDPFDTGSREREIERIGTGLGLRREGGTTPPPMGSKKALTLVVGIFVVVVVFIGVVAALIIGSMS